MKKTLLTTLLGTLTMLVPLQADASDLGLASSSYDWAGAYLGANVGGALDDVNVQRQSLYTGLLPLPPADRLLYNAARDDLSGQSSGFTGGVMAGYNWQREQVVFGIEADINALSLSGTMKRDVSSAFSALFNDPDIEAQDKVSYEIDTFGTFRGRLGFAIENVMLYGTGGLAYAHAKTDSDLYVQDGSGGARWTSSESDWNLGWTVGGGLEYGVGRWSLGIEYLYADLMPVDWKSVSDLDLASEWSMDYSFSVLRATGKVRF